MPLDISCPETGKQFSLTANNGHIEPCNSLWQTLVIKCVCGKMHWIRLPLLDLNSVLEAERERLRTSIPRALRESTLVRIGRWVKTKNRFGPKPLSKNDLEIRSEELKELTKKAVAQIARGDGC